MITRKKEAGYSTTGIAGVESMTDVRGQAMAPRLKVISDTDSPMHIWNRQEEPVLIGEMRTIVYSNDEVAITVRFKNEFKYLATSGNMVMTWYPTPAVPRMIQTNVVDDHIILGEN